VPPTILEPVFFVPHSTFIRGRPRPFGRGGRPVLKNAGDRVGFSDGIDLHDGVVVRGGRGRGCRPSVAGDRVGVSDGHDLKYLQTEDITPFGRRT